MKIRLGDETPCYANLVVLSAIIFHVGSVARNSNIVLEKRLSHHSVLRRLLHEMFIKHLQRSPCPLVEIFLELLPFLSKNRSSKHNSKESLATTCFRCGAEKKNSRHVVEFRVFKTSKESKWQVVNFFFLRMIIKGMEILTAKKMVQLFR